MAHRGGSLDYAEMSMRGYTESVALGAMGLEFSVARSSDGVFFGLHDADLNRTSPSLGSTSFKPGEHTWAEISALSVVVGTGDGRFGPQPYMKLEDMLNTYARSHTIFIDPKVVGNSNIPDLIAYLQTFPDYQNTFVGKYFHSGFVEVGRKFRAAGMKTWGYYYYDDLVTSLTAAGGTPKATNIQTTNTEWDYLGLEYTASQDAWNEVLSYGKPVIGHIVPTGAAALTALSKGASGVMASGIRSVMAARAW
nr:unknown [Clavibacter phage CN77]